MEPTVYEAHIYNEHVKHRMKSLPPKTMFRELAPLCDRSV